MAPFATLPYLATCFLSNGVDLHRAPRRHDVSSHPRHPQQTPMILASGLTPKSATTVIGDLPLAAAPVVTSDYVNPIVATTSIDLPFSSQIAYDAFSDLVRQPSWSPWLKSVKYLDDEEEEQNGTSLWTMKIAGLSYSWKSISTFQERPNVIEWESISGLRNRGRVDIQPTSADPSKCDGEECRMTLTMVFQAPRVVAALFRNDFTVLRERMEDRILSKTLSNFRDVVLATDLKSGTPEYHEEKLRDSGMLFPQ